MKKQIAMGVLFGLMITTLAWAATNLNSSRSNIYRATYPTDLASKAQISQMLTALDKIGPADEAKLKRWLAANFKRFGIEGNRIKKLVIIPPDDEIKEIAILLLTNPSDEAEARAVTIKSSKSNTSE